MTSTQSVNKKRNPVFVWYKQQVSKSLVFGILTFVIMCFAGINVVTTLGNEAVSENATTSIFYIVDACVSTYTGIMVIVMFFALAIVLRNFEYLYKKSVSDTIYALPVTNNQRFFGSLLSSLTLIVVPLLLALLSTIVIYYSVSGGRMFFAEMLKNSGIKDSDVVFIISQISLANLANTLFLAAIVVFVFCCCGVLFDGIAYTVAAAVIAPLTFSVFSQMSYAISSDYAATYNMGYSEIMQYLSPIMPLFIYNYTQLLTGEDYYSGMYDDSQGIKLIKSDIAPYYCVIIAIALVILVLAFFVHKKRCAQQVGTPFPIKMFYYVISSLVFINVGAGIYNSYISLKLYGEVYYMSTFIVTLAVSVFVFLVVEVLAERKKRATKKRIIAGVVRFVCVILVGAIAALIILDNSVKNLYDGDFDVENIRHIEVYPAIDEVGVEYDDEYGYEYSNPLMYDEFVSWATYKDREAIEKLCTSIAPFTEKIYEEYNGQGYDRCSDRIHEHNGDEYEGEKGDIVYFSFTFLIVYKDGRETTYWISANDEIFDGLGVDKWIEEYVNSEYYRSKCENYSEEYYY